MDDAVLAVENTPQSERPKLAQRINQLPTSRKLLLLGGLVLVIAAIVIGVLWARDPGYKILFANLSDKDGGQIVQSLQQQNIPYKLDPGGVISVPAELVHGARLQLASQGLPKGGTVGFELLDNQKFGISQFGEQVNYQRAVEGELARSIESLSAVAQARVHLAIPKQTVFLREQQKPTVSVLLTLHPGRMLDGNQVAGIVHLVSSSIADLPLKNVTVVDQEGTLLSKGDQQAGPDSSLTRQQMAIVQQQEALLSGRIQKILEPIVGQDNVKAEVTVQMDFSQVEQSSESFKPNTPPNGAALRSEQTSEGLGASSNTPPSGVPGALSNQPPGAASAPITQPNPPGVTVTDEASKPASHKEATRNFEVDKTISHTKQQTPLLTRVNAAVVVNFKRVQQKDGGVKSVPLTQPELNQVTNLVQEAIGYNKARNDSVKVVNAAFADRVLDVAGKSFIEKLTDFVVGHTTDIAKVILISLVLAYLLFGVVRPILRDVIRPKQEQRAAMAGEEGGVALTAEELAQSEVEAEAVAEHEASQQMAAFSELLQRAKEMAKEDPRMVATIIREWLNADPGDKSAG